MATKASKTTKVTEAEDLTQEAEGPIGPLPGIEHQEDPEAPLDAVIVVKTTDAQGNIQTEVVPNGDIRPTEVETVLKLGLAKWQRQLGL